MLTDYHKELIRRLLKGRMADSRLDTEQRATIRAICAEVMPVAEPHALLRAFVDALVQAADDERISDCVGRLLPPRRESFSTPIRPTPASEMQSPGSAALTAAHANYNFDEP